MMSAALFSKEKFKKAFERDDQRGKKQAKFTILLVDHEVHNLGTLHDILEMEYSGLKIIMHRRSDDAFHTINGDETILVAFIEERLPGTMNGHELCGLCRARGCHAVLLSPLGVDSMNHRYGDEHIYVEGTDFLPKPFNPKDVHSIVDSHLDS